jgi:2-polyprenyl-3-methyl-5-hydroxy-6-metoxy-1,4-benzoquinol methylase
MTSDTKINPSACPLCGSPDISICFQSKDYSITGEDFTIAACKNCTFRFTQHAPAADAIGAYYKSDRYISHTETKKDLISKIYHKVRNVTLKQKVKLVIKYTSKIVGHHLDIGAGTGSFVHAMEKSGWNSIGVEPDDAARMRANELYLASIYPMNELENFSEASYTAITMWHVLEHVHDLHEMIQLVHKLLDFDGKLFIAVPNHQSFDANYYGQYWAAYDLPRHLYHFTPETMKQLLKQHGLKIISIKPMWYDSFYVSMLSEQYRKGNMLRAFFVAAYSNLRAIFNKKLCSSLVYIVEKDRVK